MRKIAASLLLVVAIDARAPRAFAQSEPTVEPIPAPGPATDRIPAVPAAAPAGRAPALPGAAPQTEDEETPDPHRGAQTSREAVEPHGAQLALGVVLALVTGVAAIRVGASTTGNRVWWYTGAVLAGGAIGTGAIVCAVGQTSPTRHGGCRASIAGALIGALGVVPGLLLLKTLSSQPCTATGPNDDDACLTQRAGDAIFSLES